MPNPQIAQMLQNPQMLEMLAQRLASTGKRPPPPGAQGQPQAVPQAAPQSVAPQGGAPLQIGNLINPTSRAVMPRSPMNAGAISGPSLASLINPQGG